MRRFEWVGEGSQKFWEIDVAKGSFTVRFGRIGTEGQTKTKASKTAAADAEKLIAEKTRKGYREVGSKAKKKGAKKKGAAPAGPKTLAQEIAALEPALRRSVLPHARVTAKATKKPLPLWASKGGDGRPYLPKGTAWPSVKGKPLLPVLQIDFGDVPALPGFPRKGLLSFFWSDDFEDTKLFYFPDVVRDESKLQTEFSLPDDATLYPFEKPTALTFTAGEGCVAWGDYRFPSIVGGEDVVDALWDSPHERKLWDHIWKCSSSGEDLIGGYASPEQRDPRARKGKGLEAYEVQLLQLGNDNFDTTGSSSPRR